MNTPKPLHPRSPMSRLCRRALAASALVALAQLAVAEPPATSGGDSRVATVALSDLDLSTAEGQRIARARVTRVAQRLCWQMGESLRASNRVTLDACVRETVADAARQLRVPPRVARGE